MTHPTTALRRALAPSALLACVASAVLVACGGGVDSGGTGGVPVTALAAGPIDGYGSVIVDGIRFEPDVATLTDQDGNTLTADQLQVGMIARIDATAVQGATATATATAVAVAVAVRVSNELIGPVGMVAPAAGLISVLGQPVRVTAATWFDPALAGGITAVTAGTVVEVFGQYNARSGEYIATRIAPRNNPSAYEIRGVLSGVDPVAQTLVVGGLTIGYAGIPANAVPALVVGRFLRVSLAPSRTGATWTATSVAAGNLPWPDRPSVVVAGRISGFTSTSQFILNGIAVDATNATFPAGTAGVVLGARIVVIGSSVGNVLEATTVTLKGDETVANSTFEFHGAITALNPAAGTLTVRGITVAYDAQVAFSGGTLANLAVGKSIDVVGTLAPNRTGVIAQSIAFQ